MPTLDAEADRYPIAFPHTDKGLFLAKEPGQL